jgi:hypothetical protein
MITMQLAIALSAAALATAGWYRLVRRDRAMRSELSVMAERMRELGTRVEAAEADVAHAVTAAEISESLLVEKGIADEEDLEEARRRFNGSDPPAPRYLPDRDGDLN